MNESGEEEAEPPLYTEENLQACLDKIEVIDFQQVGQREAMFVSDVYACLDLMLERKS